MTILISIAMLMMTSLLAVSPLLSFCVHLNVTVCITRLLPMLYRLLHCVALCSIVMCCTVEECILYTVHQCVHGNVFCRFVLCTVYRCAYCKVQHSVVMYCLVSCHIVSYSAHIKDWFYLYFLLCTKWYHLMLLNNTYI